MTTEITMMENLIPSAANVVLNTCSEEKILTSETVTQNPNPHKFSKTETIIPEIIEPVPFLMMLKKLSRERVIQT